MALTICRFCNRAIRIGSSKCKNCGRIQNDLSSITSESILGGKRHSLQFLTGRFFKPADKEAANTEANDICHVTLGFILGAVFVGGIWAYVTFMKP